MRSPWLAGVLVTVIGTAGGALVSRHVTAIRGGPSTVGAAEAPTPQDLDGVNAPYDGRYHFVRVRYDPRGRGRGGFGRGRGGGPPWFHDYPRAERHFAKILDETAWRPRACSSPAT